MPPWASKPSQLWKLTRVNPVRVPVAMPALTTTNNAFLTEGVTRQNVVPSTGNVKGRIMFVQFSDVKASETSTATKAQEVIGGTKPQDFYSEMSDRKLKLQIDKNDTWATLPNPVSHYGSFNTSSRSFINAGGVNTLNSQDIIKDAKALFPGIDSKYDFFDIVLPGQETFTFALIEDKTFIYGNRGIPESGKGRNTFNHELGHLLGLPDLNLLDQNIVSDAPHSLGPWDIMAMGNGELSVIFGWHKHKLGWLKASRKT